MNLRWAQSLVAATVLASAPAPDAAPLSIPLGDPGGSAEISGSSAFGVSADGTLVVGEANGANGLEAVVWD